MTDNELWIYYNKEKDADAKKNYKKELIERYLNLVKIISSKLYIYYAKKIEFEDLMGYGVIGLIDAIDRFDHTKKIKFETYATIRIKGTIMDQIRKQDFVPRTVRQKSKQIQNSNDELEGVLGRTPTNEELADYMGITMNELHEMLGETGGLNVFYIEDDLLDAYKNQTVTRSMLDERVDNLPEQRLLKKDTVETLAKAIDATLNDTEKTVVNLYYYENMTYKEISRIVDLSESRISQIISSSLKKLRKWMKETEI